MKKDIEFSCSNGFFMAEILFAVPTGYVFQQDILDKYPLAFASSEKLSLQYKAILS